MKTACLAIAIAALAGAAQARDQGADGFVKRDSRIEGCIATVDAVRDGTLSPTEWLEQNKEQFQDLRIELEKRKYPPGKAKGMMMGMAISICMDRKGYFNKCAVDAGEETGEDGELQLMQTSAVYSCWKRKGRAEVAPPQPQPPIVWQPPPPPQQPVIVVQPPPPPMENDAFFQPAGIGLPLMSAADMAQFTEDMSIITQPVRIIGDDEGGRKEARFASCADYWQSLHYNRSPDARQVLYAVRVARCMYRDHFALIKARSGCGRPGGWQQATQILLSPRCYARF